MKKTQLERFAENPEKDYRPRFSIALVGACMLAGALQLFVLMFQDGGAGYDTIIYAKAIHGVLHDGVSLYGPDIHRFLELLDARPRQLPDTDIDRYIYPPSSIVPILWMGFVDSTLSYRLTGLLGFFGMVLSICWWRKGQSTPTLPADRDAADTALLLGMFLALCWYPFSLGTALGNLTSWSFFFSMAYLHLSKSRPWLAGIALGLGTTLKIYPIVLLLPTVIRRRHIELTSFLVTCGVLIGISLLIVPAGEYQVFLLDLSPWMSAHFDRAIYTQSFIGLLDRAFYWSEISPVTGRWLPIPQNIGTLATILSITLVAAISLKLWKSRHSPKQFRLTTFALLAGIPLLSPKGHAHILIFATPLLLSWLQAIYSQPRFRPIVLLLAIAVVYPMENDFVLTAYLPAPLAWIWYSRFALLACGMIGWALAAGSNLDREHHRDGLQKENATR